MQACGSTRSDQLPVWSLNYLMPDAAGSAPGAVLYSGTALLIHELSSWHVGVEIHGGMAEKGNQNAGKMNQ